MPHSTAAPVGFQALILCGPGASLNTFTHNPAEFPKALLPVANRPMVWYPLDWCYRMGISTIHIITPPEAKNAIEAALSQNPHLTSLPSPRATILAPSALTFSTGTAEIFRLPEVQAVITGDFLILPCDLVTELDGTQLIQEWMIEMGGLGDAKGGVDAVTGKELPLGPGGEKMGRRGGISVWYDSAEAGEESDFMATTPISNPNAPTKGHRRLEFQRLVSSMPMDSVKEKMASDKGLQIRHQFLHKFGSLTMHTKKRDSHVYIFPFWVKSLMCNQAFENIGEDVLGWWSKAVWQDGLADKLAISEIFGLENRPSSSEDFMSSSIASLKNPLDEEVNVADFITTRPRNPDTGSPAAKIRGVLNPTVPPILAYIHPSASTDDAEKTPLIRRVDTTTLLLSTSMALAKLPAIQPGSKTRQSSPLSHAAKIAHPQNIPRQTRVEESTCLLADNVTVAEKCQVKESVIGAGCTIGTGARLLKCVLMEDVVVGDNVSLSGCVVGVRAKIEGGPRSGERTDLRDCEVQHGYVVPWATDGKNEKYSVFEGLTDDAVSNPADGDADAL